MGCPLFYVYIRIRPVLVFETQNDETLNKILMCFHYHFGHPVQLKGFLVWFFFFRFFVKNVKLIYLLIFLLK